MTRFLVALLAVLGLGLLPLAQAPAADAAGVNCAVLIFKPTHYWRQGSWSPQSLRGTRGMDDWYRRCSGRFRPLKRSPNTQPGPWDVNIRLNRSNCTYTADQDLRDWGWWVRARIHIS